MSEILDDMFDEALRFEQEEHVEREYEIEYKDKQISSLKAALKEKDARIKELEAALWEWLKVRLQPDSEVLRLVGISLKALEARG